MKLLICGSRMRTLPVKRIREELDRYIDGPEWEIVEGCCPNSPDAVAEEWAEEHNIVLHHFPADAGNYIRRNIEMVKMCDEILAFSYGTAHTIAQGVMNGKKVRVVSVNSKGWES